jgi:hypothetical protein
METALLIVGLTIFVLLGFVLVGGPMFVTDVARARRQAMIARQIALTDALDNRLGPLVAPVVTKPFIGPWEVRIAAPPLGSAMLARMIAVIHDVFSADGDGEPSRFRIVLSLNQDTRLTVERQSPRPATRWSGSPVAAA